MFIYCILLYWIKVNMFTRLECFAAKCVCVCYTNTYFSSVLCARPLLYKDFVTVLASIVPQTLSSGRHL